MEAHDEIALPIASVVVNSSGEQTGNLLGTGFFLNGHGAFATARHVVDRGDRPIQVGLRLNANNIRETTWVPVREWHFAPSGIDVAIAQLPHSMKPTFDAGSPSNGIWQEVVTMGYPERAFRHYADGFVATGTGLRGHIAATFQRPSLVGITFKGELIQTTFAIPRGVSGAPLMAKFGDELRLVGICVGSWESDEFEYEIVHVKDGDKEYRETKRRTELFGLAVSITSLASWIVPGLEKPFPKILDKYVT